VDEMIRVSQLHKFFNKGKLNEIHVINNTNLTFPETGLVAITGPSGCGKTTLLNVIGGLDKVDAGTIEFDQTVLRGYHPAQWDIVRNQYVGYIFQNYNLIQDKTVYENVEIALNMAGLYDKDEIEKRINYVLTSVGMYNYRRRNVLALSGGQQQRVAIARAIAKNPKVVLADEPTGNLDANNTFEVMSIIKKISQTCLVILVSHERELVDFYADRVIELSDGVVTKDYENEGNRTLEHIDDRNIYLQDLTSIDVEGPINAQVFYENELTDKPEVKFVYFNNTLFVKVDSKTKVKYLTNESEIQLLNEHYKKPETNDASKYTFDLHQFGEIKQMIRRSFIRFRDTLKSGFRKVFGKRKFFGKLFLLAYFAISGLVVFNLASLGNLTKVDETQFLNTAKDLLAVQQNDSMTQEKFDQLFGLSSIEYAMPYQNGVYASVFYTDLYQGASMRYYNTQVLVYPVSKSFAGDVEVVSGKLPEDKYEIAIDEWIADKILESKVISDIGVVDYTSLLGAYINNGDFNIEIVGVVSTSSPIAILTDNNIEYFIAHSNYQTIGSAEGEYTIDTGRTLQNANEVLVHTGMGVLGEDITLLGETFTIVGLYSSDSMYYPLISNEDSVWLRLQTMFDSSDTNTFLFKPVDMASAISNVEALGLTATDSYAVARAEYIDALQMQVSSRVQTILITLAGIIVYIFFIMRSSMLSRIKEIGIYRSIGATKKDIYKIFFSEILAFTTVGSLTGYLFMAYVVNRVQNMIQDFVSVFYFPIQLFVGGIVLIYAVNILFGMLPVMNLLRKTPSEINAKFDI